jgi:hypothetical protein
MNRNTKHRPLIVIATVLIAVPVVSLGAPVRFQEFVRLGGGALGLPCRIAASLRSLPERVDPSCSECN